jgi:PAS domain S-box-containing protein
MPYRSGHIGHALINRRREVVDIDEGYAALIGIERGAVIGRLASEFAHPQERLLADAFLQTAWHDPGQKTHRGTLRCMQADGGLVWLNVSVSRLGQGDAAVLVVSARLLCRHAETQSVHAYWRMARVFLHAVHGSKSAFGAALTSNPACEILLIAYLAEAEATTVTADDVAATIGTSPPLANRWILALIEAGFIEMEAPGVLGPQTPIRLSPLALSLIEALFSSLGEVMQEPRVPA